MPQIGLRAGWIVGPFNSRPNY